MLPLREIFNQVFSNSADAIAITDSQTNVLDVNPAFEKITGYSREEAVGKKTNILRSGKTPKETFVDMWEKLNSEGRWVGELINTRKDGNEWVSYISITRISTEQGVIGYVGISRDISQTKNLQKNLLRQVEEVAATQEVTVTMLAKLSECRDPSIEGHLRRLKAYTNTLAREMVDCERCIDQNYLRLLENSSTLHDVGKVGIPEGILLKPDLLSPEEFAVMKLHTTLGGRLLEDGEGKLKERLGVSETFLTQARDIALYHHEKYDGTGYPMGLRGDQIPLSARIVALADVYDALTSRRVYKDAWTHEKALAWITSASGKHFDPQVVEAFRRRESAFIEISADR
jgi:putative two-component system response regulator